VDELASALGEGSTDLVVDALLPETWVAGPESSALLKLAERVLSVTEQLEALAPQETSAVVPAVSVALSGIVVVVVAVECVLDGVLQVVESVADGVADLLEVISQLLAEVLGLLAGGLPDRLQVLAGLANLILVLLLRNLLLLLLLLLERAPALGDRVDVLAGPLGEAGANLVGHAELEELWVARHDARARLPLAQGVLARPERLQILAGRPQEAVAVSLSGAGQAEQRHRDRGLSHWSHGNTRSSVRLPAFVLVFSPA